MGVGEDNDGERNDEAGHHQEDYVAAAVKVLVVRVPVRTTGAAQTLRDVPEHMTRSGG